MAVVGFRVTIENPITGERTDDDRWTSASGGGTRLRECKPPKTKRKQRPATSRVRLDGPISSGRMDLVQWYTDCISNRDFLRNVIVTPILQDPGLPPRDGPPTNYFDCFITSYSITPLDSRDSGSIAKETLHFEVSRIELA